jgi:hypothetical protein
LEATASGETGVAHHLLEDLIVEQQVDPFMGAILQFLKEDMLPDDDAVT